MTPRVTAALVAALALAAAAVPGTMRAADAPLATAGDVGLAGRLGSRPDLRRFYEARGFAPVWGPDAEGRERASRLLAALADAATHGLDPRRHEIDAARPEAGEAAERELGLTDAFVRYAVEVRRGRVQPHHVESDWDLAPEPLDALAALAEGAQSADAFGALLTTLPPPDAGYAALREALRRLRAREASGGWPTIAAGSRLRPGAHDPRVPALRRRLAASGDLPPSRARARVAAARYDGDLVAAVRRFQARHGLHPDGIVGAATIAALNVSAAERARQVTLNLERWRWLPRALEARHIAVNAAAASLEAVEANRAVLTSRVVVGEPRFPTPVLRASVEAVVVNPPWRVPPSIATGEILPRLREDRWYLADNEIVILERWDSDAFGLGIDWSTVSAEPFPFRLWQRPGPANPLGRLKLDMPNRFHVHLHDTPARSLFEGPVRAASHGCVRVERARALAAWVLDTPGAGEKPDVEAMIAAGATRRVAVPAPVPVYLLYWTAFVDAEGVLHFRDDVYGRDARLAAALEGRPAAPAIPGPAPASCPPDADGRG